MCDISLSLFFFSFLYNHWSLEWREKGNDKQTGQNVATGESGLTSIEAACARGYYSSLNSKLPKNERNFRLYACSEEPSLRVPWASVSSVAKSSSCLHSARLLWRLKQQTSEQNLVQSCFAVLHSGTRGLGCPRLRATSCRVLEEQPQTPCYLSPSQCSALSLPGSACLFFTESLPVCSCGQWFL